MKRFCILTIFVLQICLVGCEASLSSIRGEMGSQKGLQPNKPSVGAKEAQIKEGIDAAVFVAAKLGFQYDASKSEDGVVIVTALWKGSPVTLTMQFHSEITSVHLASLRSQAGLANLEDGGRKIERLYYTVFRKETDKHGLIFYPDSNEESFRRLRLLTLPPEKASKEKAAEQDTGFYGAVNRGDVQAVKRFLESGTDPDTPLIYNRTALMIAAGHGHAELVSLLLEHRAGINAGDFLGDTALMLAAGSGQTAVVEMLLMHGADVNRKDDNLSRTALAWAAYQNHAGVAAILIKSGADANVQDKFGYSALMYAVENGNPEIVGLLLTHGAGVNTRDKNGETALMKAAKSGNVEIVSVLLQMPFIDVNATDKNSTTALMYARHSGNNKVVDVLKHAGASNVVYPSQK